MSKFTKGPWEIKPLEDDKEYIRIRGTVLGGRFKIANVGDGKFHHDNSDWCKFEREEAKANAHLIAAAPEMYEMLSEIKQVIESGHELGEMVSRVQDFGEEINELLAKARGEQ